ncbi:hypothetical protein Tco_1345370 [Tanacetum coccineum]
MHNNIMAVGSKDRPPMLATGRYAQWRSRFLRYLDTKPNGDALRKCILEGPYKPTTLVVPAVVATDDSVEIREHTAFETILNMTPANKAHFEAEKEAIFMMLTGIGDEIYSTVDACQTTNEMWIAIERLQHGESLNIQDVKTNLFWEFGKFTSRDGESMESYYSRFYKMMNEMIRNNLKVDTMQVNVQFLQQLQPEWSRYKGKEVAKPVTPPSELGSDEESHPEQAEKDKEMQKNLALIAKYFKKLYKPTNNNLRTSSNSRNKTVDTYPRYKNDNQSGQFRNQRTMTVARARETVGGQECRKPKPVKDYTYHKEKMLLCKQAEQGVPLQAKQVDWLADTDEEVDEQELEAHYCFMAKIQEVLPTDSDNTVDPLEEVQYHNEYNVFANERQHSEQPESTNDTHVLEKDDSNVIPDSSNMCNNDNQVDQNDAECSDERVALANLIANLTLDTEQNKKILMQLKKANASLTHELEKCKSNLEETNRALGETTSSRDSCLIALQTKQTEFEKYIAFNDRTVDYDKLQSKLNETLGLLAQKDNDIKEGLKLKAYEISVVKQKHDELVKQSLLTKSQFEGLLKEKSKVIPDLKVKEGKDINKMIAMEKQLKFLNEIIHKRNESIQTIHMLAPKCSIYNRRPTFANPMYLKKAQAEKPCLYEIPYDTSDLANRFAPDWEETLTLEKESRSKMDTDFVKPFDYTKFNSLYEIFKPPSQEYLDQLAHAKEVRRKMWRKSFVKTKPNIVKNIAFLPILKSISKSRQAYNVMTNNINHFNEIVDQAWVKHTYDSFSAPTALDMEVLIKTCLMPLSLKIQNDSFQFVHELKKEMHDDFKYVESLEKEIDELKSNKADFSNMYDLLLQEYKNIAISELKKLIEKFKGQGVDTNFEQSSILGKLPLQPFRNQPVKSSFPKPSNVNAPGPSRKSPKHVSFQLQREYVDSNDMVHNYYLKEAKKNVQPQKEVTAQLLPQTACKAVRNINVLKPGMYRINSMTTQTRAPQLPQTSRNTNHHMSTSTRVIHRTSVSRPQPKSTEVKDKVVQNNSQVKFKKTQVEDHRRISSISKKTKSVTACNDSLNSRTSNVNDVCADYGKCVFNSIHDACVSKYLNEVNARTKKPNVVPIST